VSGEGVGSGRGEELMKVKKGESGFVDRGDVRIEREGCC
jgi:hypothetical protein